MLFEILGIKVNRGLVFVIFIVICFMILFILFFILVVFEILGSFFMIGDFRRFLSVLLGLLFRLKFSFVMFLILFCFLK